EIGWFLLTLQAPDEPVARLLEGQHVFHWHGDTFELPAGAVLLASSEACRHQAFRLGDHVFGFQFHLETTPASAAALIEHCAADLDGSAYVQSAARMAENPADFARINDLMSAVLQQILQIPPANR